MYPLLMSYLTDELWSLRESKLRAIVAFLEAQSEGVKFTQSEIQARTAGRPVTAERQQAAAVAIMPLRGVIANRINLLNDISGGTSAESFGRMFQAALRSSEVRAIVIDVDSPGGAVSGTDELSSMIHAARGTKPIIAHVNATAASSAYWIASAADEVVVTPSGAVGSIGVFAVHDDVSGALDKAGVKRTLISAGRLKTDGHPFGPLEDDARGRIQARVQASYETFVKAVARNRNVTPATVRNGFGQGDMVDAAAAVRQGMADRTGTLEQVLQRFGVSLYSPAPAPAPGRSRAASSSGGGASKPGLLRRRLELDTLEANLSNPHNDKSI